MVTGVTEQQAGVSTGRFELLLTDGAARVRNQPRISWRILKLPTVTRVPEHTTKKLLNSEVYSQHLFFNSVSSTHRPVPCDVFKTFHSLISDYLLR